MVAVPVPPDHESIGDIIEGPRGVASPGACARAMANTGIVLERGEGSEVMVIHITELSVRGARCSCHSRQVSGRNQTRSQSPCNRLRARCHVEFSEYPVCVVADSPFTEPKYSGDLPVGFSFLHPTQHGQFPRRQVAGAFGKAQPTCVRCIDFGLCC